MQQQQQRFLPFLCSCSSSSKSRVVSTKLILTSEFAFLKLVLSILDHEQKFEDEVLQRKWD